MGENERESGKRARMGGHTVEKETIEKLAKSACPKYVVYVTGKTGGYVVNESTRRVAEQYSISEVHRVAGVLRRCPSLRRVS